MAVSIDVASAELKVWKPCAPAPRSASENSFFSASWIWNSPRLVDLGLRGFLHHARADVDQLATQRQVMNQPGVIQNLRAERRRVQQVRQIPRAADFHELAIAFKMLAQRHAVRNAAASDKAIQHVEDRSIGRRIEIARLQNVAHALVCVVVEQDRAQHGHFGLQVVRGRQLLRRFVVFRHGLSLGQSSL